MMNINNLLIKLLKSILTFSAILICLTVGAEAKTVTLEAFGAIPNDEVDDAPAFRAAWNKLRTTGGGTIQLTEGTYKILTPIDFTTQNDYISLKIAGNQGAVLDISVGSGTDAFFFGNLNIVTLENIIFMGKKVAYTSPSFLDARRVIGVAYVPRFIVTGCSFYNLGVKESVIYVAPYADAVIEKCDFGGVAAGKAAIHGFEYRGLTVRETNFVDYIHYRNMLLTKTPAFGVGAWIKAEINQPFVNYAGIRRLKIEDCVLDEGVTLANIIVDGAEWVEIKGIGANISGAANTTGIILNRVKLAQVTSSWFGLVTVPRPAMKITNSGDVEITSLKFMNSVTPVETDNSNSLSTRFCPDCVAPQP